MQSRQDAAKKVGNFATHSVESTEPETIISEPPDYVSRARKSQPDGSKFRDSVQNDLGGGLWTSQINGTSKLPVYVEGDMSQSRGHRFNGSTSDSGIWLRLGNKTLFVADGDERTRSQRIQQAADVLRTGGGYHRKKIGSKPGQVSS
jgi:hypothetical protein